MLHRVQQMADRSGLGLWFGVFLPREGGQDRVLYRKRTLHRFPMLERDECGMHLHHGPKMRPKFFSGFPPLPNCISYLNKAARRSRCKLALAALPGGFGSKDASSSQPIISSFAGLVSGGGILARKLRQNAGPSSCSTETCSSLCLTSRRDLCHCAVRPSATCRLARAAGVSSSHLAVHGWQRKKAGRANGRTGLIRDRAPVGRYTNTDVESGVSLPG